MKTIIQGEKRYLSFNAVTNGFAQCSQITVILRNIVTGVTGKQWLKVTGETATDGEVEATPGEDNKAFRVWLSDTEDLSGVYNLYITREISGEKMPVLISKFENYLEVTD